MTRAFALLSILAALLLGAAPASAADKLTQKRYPLPEQRGTFLLSAPASWKDEVNQPPQPVPPTILFGPSATGKPFQVHVTPIWKPSPDLPTPTRDELRSQVQRDADGLKSERIANEIKVVDLQGKNGPGFYYAATDKAPEPGEFKHLTQGRILVSDLLLVTFAILTNDGQEQVVRDALNMIRSSSHSPK